MEVKIHNYLAASWLLETEPGDWDIIVILDSDCQLNPFVAEKAARYLVLFFDDIQAHQTGKRMVNADHIQTALDFSSQSQRLVVSCRAGQSRSAAIGCLVQFFNDPGFKPNQLLDPKRHSPNALVMDQGARLIDNPAIWPLMMKWWRDSAGCRISDYLHLIEAEFDELHRAGAVEQITA